MRLGARLGIPTDSDATPWLISPRPHRPLGRYGANVAIAPLCWSLPRSCPIDGEPCDRGGGPGGVSP